MYTLANGTFVTHVSNLFVQTVKKLVQTVENLAPNFLDAFRISTVGVALNFLDAFRISTVGGLRSFSIGGVIFHRWGHFPSVGSCDFFATHARI